MPKLARWEERTWSTAPRCGHRGVLRAHRSSFSVRTPGLTSNVLRLGVGCPGAKREITPLASALELGGASPCSEERAHLDARRWWDAPSCFDRLGPTVPNLMTSEPTRPARTRTWMLWFDGRSALARTGLSRRLTVKKVADMALYDTQVSERFETHAPAREGTLSLEWDQHAFPPWKRCAKST